MSDFVIHKGLRASGSFARHYGADTKSVEFSAGARTSVVLADGRQGLGSCVGCGTAPCMEKQASELTLPGAIEAYPGDPSLEVCPTRALEWDTKARAVTVLTDACIGCGLCASRCPYGAISLAGGSVAEVAMDDPDGLVTLGVTEATHPSPQLHGAIASTTAPAAEGLPASISKLSDTKSALLVRNLLNEVCLLYTSPSPRDGLLSRMPSSA